MGGGLTEPGSSGSPLFDSQGRVRGTLTCGTTGCANANTDSYGKLSTVFLSLSPWLDPEEVVYLDANYDGGFEAGSTDRPFNSLAESMFAVQEGGTLLADPGTYDGGSLTIKKAMTLDSTGGTATFR